jgi:hypothetical protein
MSDRDGEQALSFEIALRVADAAVFAKTSRHLRNQGYFILKSAKMCLSP